MMDRREFLKTVTLASVAPIWVRFAPSAPRPAATPPKTDHLLLVLYLAGGNDGLNTVVPYLDPAYKKNRPTVGLTQSDVNPLGEGLGLHNALARVNDLWKAGQLGIVQNVGYPKPNYSHFESTHIWETASPEHRLHSGWLGRYLDATDSTSRGPVRAVAVGMDSLPTTLVGNTANGVALTSLADFSFADDGRPDTRLRRNAFAAFDSGRSDSSMRSNVLQAQRVAVRAVDAVAGTATKMNLNLTPAQTVAAMFAAGVGTEIGFIRVGGFDTHTDERAYQAKGLHLVDKAIGEFFDAAKGYGIADRVTVMTFTDFGRRVGDNASGGTDHGSSGPILVMGPKVNGGVYGDRPDLTKLNSDGNLIPAIHLGAVYSSIVSQAFHVEPSPIIGGDYPMMPLIS